MDVLLEQKRAWLDHFRAANELHSGNGMARLASMRREAIQRFDALGIPSADHEEWRFTNIAPLLQSPFVPGDSAQRGARDKSLKSERRTDGVLVCSLADAICHHWALMEPHLAVYADSSSHGFVALNTALFTDGVFVHVPAGVKAHEPIQIEHRTIGPKALWSRRSLVVLGASSEAQIVESFEGTGEYFTSAVTEAAVAENASLDYHRLQRESPAAVHVSTVQVHQARDSRFHSHAFDRGGKLSRNDLNIVLAGEGCESTLDGLFRGTGEQVIDNHTRIDHARPRCNSRELYKGILGERARGVFTGRIHVHPDAQKTDAKQSSKTLLLSDDARINAQPQLEIYADDVKCTHGASIGQLDDEQIFYLRSRGIGADEARNLLIFAFANEIVDQVGIDSLRRELEQELLRSTPAPSIVAAGE